MHQLVLTIHMWHEWGFNKLQNTMKVMFQDVKNWLFGEGWEKSWFNLKMESNMGSGIAIHSHSLSIYCFNFPVV
jgi:hypothetical protein